MKLTDYKKVVEIRMNLWTGYTYTPDFSHDFFDGTTVVDDVDYCIDQANDWANYRGDFYDPDAEENDKSRGIERCVEVNFV